jgi:ATP-dependent Clp protease protease subunit
MNVITCVSPLIKEIELRANPIIIRVNEFDEDSAKEFAQQMSSAQSSGQSIVPIIIDSYGGQVYSLMSMIGNIKSSKIPVATIVEGKAMSCGAILFSFGTQGYRFVDPDATIMIHDVSSGVHGKIEDIKADSKEAERLNQKVYKMMAANCGKSPDYFLDIIHEKGHADWYIDADEALNQGLANHKRVPTLKIVADIKFNFD